MKRELESFKTEELFQKAISGSMEEKDFKLFKHFLTTMDNNQQHNILVGLSKYSTDTAFHKLVGGIMLEDSNFKKGDITNLSNISNRLLYIEAYRYQEPITKNNTSIEKALNITLSHFSPDSLDKEKLKGIIDNTYGVIVKNSNQFKRSSSYDYYFDPSSIGNDYGPSQKDLDNFTARENEREQKHKLKVLNLENKIVDLYATDETISSIKSHKIESVLEHNDATIKVPANFIKELIAKNKLPEKIHDPVDKKASVFVDEIIIPKIDKLIKLSEKQPLDKKVVADFVSDISENLKKIGVKDFNQKAMLAELNEVCSDTKHSSKFKLGDRVLHSISETFKKSDNKLMHKLAGFCDKNISKDYLKNLASNKEVTKIIPKAITNNLISKANTISSKIALHLSEQRTSNAIPANKKTKPLERGK